MGQLKQRGFQITADPKEAETVVVNTCGFIEAAKKESIEAILEATRLKTDGKAKRLVVAGCMVQKYGAELARGRAHSRITRLSTVRPMASR